MEEGVHGQMQDMQRVDEVGKGREAGAGGGWREGVKPGSAWAMDTTVSTAQWSSRGLRCSYGKAHAEGHGEGGASAPLTLRTAKTLSPKSST